MIQHAFEFFDDIENARRWFVILRRTYLAEISNKEWLEEIDSKLKKKIIEWIDNDSEARVIQTFANFFNENKQRYIELLIVAFFEKKKFTVTKVELMRQVETLHQKKSEFIEKYYNRVSFLLQKMKIKNCIKNIEKTQFDESMILTIVINNYVKNLIDRELFRKIIVKYYDVIDHFIKSLKEAYDTTEIQWRFMKSKKAQRKKNVEKINFEREHLIFNVMREIITKESNRHKIMRILHIFFNVSFEFFNTIFVMQSNARFEKQQKFKISSNERVQDVTHENQHMKSSIVNFIIFNTRYQSRYSSQNSRDQRQILNQLIIVFAFSTFHDRFEDFFKFEINETFDIFFHLNSFINESIQYERMIHDIVCFKCEKSDHRTNECDNSKILSYFESRALKTALNYVFKFKSSRQQYEQLTKQKQNIKSNQAIMSQSKKIVMFSYHFTMKAATYYTEEHFNFSMLFSIFSKFFTIWLFQFSVFDSKNEERALYKFVSRFYALKFEKIFDE